MDLIFVITIGPIVSHIFANKTLGPSTSPCAANLSLLWSQLPVTKGFVPTVLCDVFVTYCMDVPWIFCEDSDGEGSLFGSQDGLQCFENIVSPTTEPVMLPFQSQVEAYAQEANLSDEDFGEAPFACRTNVSGNMTPVGVSKHLGRKSNHVPCIKLARFHFSA